MIIYFSGTGNSKYLGEKLGYILDDQVICGNEYIKSVETGDFFSEKPFIFVGPIYAWRMPRIFRDFIDRSSFSGTGKDLVYFILNAGDSVGGAKTDVLQLSYKKDFKLKGIVEIIMPENYIALFSAPTIEEERKILKKADEELVLAGKYIENQETYSNFKSGIIGKFSTSIVNPIFYKFFISDRKFSVNETCISCGICEKKCPLNNIKLENGLPTWKGNCTHCMACINYCPKEAINYGKSTENKRRYIGPKFEKKNVEER